MRNEKLISALGNCINHCNYCADACLDEDHVKKMVDCIRLDRVCAEVCSALNQVLAIDYKDVRGLVEYCKKVCQACADECGKHDAKHCKDCAVACKQCVKACETFLA
ncbi:four-helix bundle copper-binding protein [Gramella sp. GC03-9]|uniref:Four-helix bundle copper-binding protein n=1 Tax=Christiangramia oceanisediminis TaxID=2920386 RepID=A0A9X2KWQ0_9FLAO|nr:four-helix bundle copper-binding protein [Gramella oceanisediminis]MCP9199694.1 four-helix bundle copper-binding protein [Gramella oceanisediminis]